MSSKGEPRELWECACGGAAATRPAFSQRLKGDRGSSASSTGSSSAQPANLFPAYSAIDFVIGLFITLGGECPSSLLSLSCSS